MDSRSDSLFLIKERGASMTSSTATRSFRILRNQNYQCVDGKLRYMGLIFSPTTHEKLSVDLEANAKYWGFVIHPAMKASPHQSIATFFLKGHRLTESELASVIRFIAKEVGVETKNSMHLLSLEDSSTQTVYRVGLHGLILKTGPHSYLPLRMTTEDLPDMLHLAYFLEKGNLPLALKFANIVNDESCDFGKLSFNITGQVVHVNAEDEVIVLSSFSKVTPVHPEATPFDGWGRIYIHRSYFGLRQPKIGQDIHLYNVHLRIVPVWDPSDDWRKPEERRNLREIRVAQDMYLNYR